MGRRSRKHGEELSPEALELKELINHQRRTLRDLERQAQAAARNPQVPRDSYAAGAAKVVRMRELLKRQEAAFAETKRGADPYEAMRRHGLAESA